MKAVSASHKSACRRWSLHLRWNGYGTGFSGGGYLCQRWSSMVVSLPCGYWTWKVERSNSKHFCAAERPS